MTAGNTASVEGRGNADFAEGELIGSAYMHGMGLTAILRRLVGDFRRGDDEGVALFGQFIGAAQMIPVGMGNEDVVHLQVFHGHMDGVPVQERIADQGLAPCGNGKAGMVDKFKFCRHNDSSFF